MIPPFLLPAPLMRELTVFLYDGADAGWYIDDVEVVTVFPFFPQPEDFEFGWGDWSTDNGVWEIGEPGSPGPDSAHSPVNCAGTELTGLYPQYQESRLISPAIQLPESLEPGEELQLRFWHWFKFEYEDGGDVQISSEMSPGEWSAWESLSQVSGSSSVWSPAIVDLYNYLGSKVRIGFRLDQDIYGGADAGWYIDDVRIEGIPETAVDDDQPKDTIPKTFALHQNYPNPFNPSTTISIEIPGSADVKQPVSLIFLLLLL